MRVCKSCGRENPDERDFCECGEYLRWEPTNFVPAVSAPASDPAKTEEAPAQELDPNVTVAADAAGPGRAWGAPAAPGGLGSGVAPMPGTPGSGDAPPGAAALMLRLPEDDSASPGPVRVLVNPGEGVVIVGLIRNQSEVVDNFDLSVRGLPEDWWTISPATAYLVPYGSGGTYEQEIQIQIHPPRAPQSQARPWPFEVVAESRAYGGEVASSSATATVGPYFDVATELRPERASGRLKARYRLIVRNKANARTEVALSAEDTDAECEFRFAEPKIALEPGNAMECPFTVLPPKQKWIGKPQDRQFQVTAAPVGVETPSPPRMAVFRQRPWLPWWLAIAVPVVAALAVLAIKLMPKQAVIPNLKGQPSVFAAQKLLNKGGFVLAPKPVTVANASKPAGSIADQSPAAGTKAKKGTVVTLKIYTGTGKATVPNVVGETPGAADQALRASSLALGTVSPQPLNPQGKISSQIPLANASVPNGTAVAVFLASTGGKGGSAAGGNASASKKGGAGAGTAAAAAAGAASVAAVAAQAGKGPIPIPALSGDPTKAAAKLSQLGLVPHPVKQLATVPIGQVAGTIPAAGSKVPKGAQVDLIISNGSPQLSYDNGQTISVVNPSTGKPSGAVPAGAGGTQVEAAWSNDGTQLVYSQNGQLVLDNPNDKSVKPFQMTTPQSGITNLDPSFAPTNSKHIVAFIQRSANGTTALCFATVGPFALNRSCTNAPGWELGNQINWAPGGQTILVFGAQNGGHTFGLLAFNSNVPYSTQGSDWGHGTLQTNDAVSGEGVVAGAVSPNGKKMALVSNIGTGNNFFLYIVPAGNFQPNASQQLPVSACQVSWRSDSQEVAVMQPNGMCTSTALGTISAISLANPLSPRTLTSLGAHPAWEPVPTGG